MSRQQLGYTLVEVLVVLAMLGLLIPAFFGLISTTIFSYQDARLRTAATLLAEEKLETLLAHHSSLVAGQRNIGERQPYRFETEVANAGDMLMVRVKISWVFRQAERQIEVVTYAAPSL